MVNEEEKEILERKYLMRQTWEKISYELGCDRSTALRKHGNALKNLKFQKLRLFATVKCVIVVT